VKTRLQFARDSNSLWQIKSFIEQRLEHLSKARKAANIRAKKSSAGRGRVGVSTGFTLAARRFGLCHFPSSPSIFDFPEGNISLVNLATKKERVSRTLKNIWSDGVSPDGRWI